MILTSLITGRFSRAFQMATAVLLIAGQLAGAGHVHAHGDHHEHGHDCDHGHYHEHGDHHQQWHHYLATAVEGALGHEKPEHGEDHHNCDVCRLAGRDHDAIPSIVPPIRTPVTVGYRLVSPVAASVASQSRSLAYQGRAPPLA